MRAKIILGGCLVAALLFSTAGCGSSKPDSQNSRFQGKADTAAMMQTIDYLAGSELNGRATGSPESAVLEQYLEQRFSDLGLEPASVFGLSGYRQEFQVPSERVFIENMPAGQAVTAANILGEIPGQPGSQTLVLAANYDGLGSDPKTGSFFPGADYNASGVSAVLELARIFTLEDKKPQKNVVFALMGGEECGNYGAQTLAEAIESGGMTGSVSVINIEGIGAGQGDYMDVWDLDYGKNKKMAEALDSAAAAVGVTLEPGGQDAGTSANVFFLYHEAAVTCDWSWYERSEHPDFHTTNDTPDKINQDGLRSITEVVAEATWNLAY